MSYPQTIQWYPGHMTKTRRQIGEWLRFVDIVAEIVDARAPISSRNPDLDSLTAGKPRILVLNKCDMSDPAENHRWVDYYKAQGANVVAVDCKSGKGIEWFIPMVRFVLNKKIAMANSRGIKKTIRVMVLGIPNVGKSSFINRLIGNKKAKVEDRPGVTMRNQWFAIADEVELLDTPGVLWPKFDDASVGEKLAFIGAVKDQVTDAEQLAARLLEVLCGGTYRKGVLDRYRLDERLVDGGSGADMLRLIGKKRGALMSGGEVDLERAATIVLDEFRDAKLGRVTLD